MHLEQFWQIYAIRKSQPLLRHQHFHPSQSFLFLFFNWSTVDLQCWANLLYSKQLSYIHIYILFLYSFPLWFIPADWIYFPVLYNRTLLFIHSKCNHLHQLTPNSQWIPLPPPTLATTRLLSISVSLLLFCRQVYLCHILDFMGKYHSQSFFVPSLLVIPPSSL